jgi:hypothetical protein
MELLETIDGSLLMYHENGHATSIDRMGGTERRDIIDIDWFISFINATLLAHAEPRKTSLVPCSVV